MRTRATKNQGLVALLGDILLAIALVLFISAFTISGRYGHAAMIASFLAAAVGYLTGAIANRLAQNSLSWWRLALALVLMVLINVLEPAFRPLNVASHPVRNNNPLASCPGAEIDFRYLEFHQQQCVWPSGARICARTMS